MQLTSCLLLSLLVVLKTLGELLVDLQLLALPVLDLLLSAGVDIVEYVFLCHLCGSKVFLDMRSIKRVGAAGVWC